MSNNIFIAQEVLRNYHRSDTRSRCAIKVDLHKAFDTVKWSFLLELLAKMGFPFRFISWVRTCITTPRYSENLLASLVPLGDFGKVTRFLPISLLSSWMACLCSFIRILRQD